MPKEFQPVPYVVWKVARSLVFRALHTFAAAAPSATWLLAVCAMVETYCFVPRRPDVAAVRTVELLNYLAVVSVGEVLVVPLSFGLRRVADFCNACKCALLRQPAKVWWGLLLAASSGSFKKL